MPGDAAKRTSKAYRAQVWLLMDDLEWALLRLQEECARNGKRDEVVGPKDYPNIVYSLGERVWRLELRGARPGRGQETARAEPLDRDACQGAD